MAQPTVSDLEYEYWAGLSGLLPKLSFTLADHKRAALDILVP